MTNGVAAVDRQLQQHTRRIVGLAGFITLVVVVLEFTMPNRTLGAIGTVLGIGVIVGLFLMLFRFVNGLVAFVGKTARQHSRMSLTLLEAVEQFAHESAGLRGTIEALSVAASDAGCEVLVWDDRERVLWVPSTGERVTLTVAASRNLLERMSLRRPLNIPDVCVSSVLPAELAQRDATVAIISAPMWANDDFIGLVLRRYESASAMLRSDEAGLVSGLAAVGAVAVGKAVIVDREQQRAQDNALLLRSVKLASEGTDEGHQITDYAVQAAEALGAERSAIYAVNGGQLRLVGSCGVARTVAMSARRISLRSGLVQALELTKGAPLCAHASSYDESTVLALRQVGMSDQMVVQPVCENGRIVGCIALHGVAVDLGDREAALLSALARQVSMALERQRMWRANRKRSKHLACTPKLARSLTGQRDPEAVSRIAARELHEGFGFGRVTIALREADGELHIVASAGMLSRPGPPVTSTNALQAAFTDGRPYVCCASESRQSMEDPNAPAGCRSQIVVPITNSDHETIGVIAVYERDADVLGEDDLHMLETIADQLAGTLEQATLFATLERSYFKTVEALSAALEAKDAYTLDHARSITETAAAVGRRLGMGENEVRDLKFGALLHDIGKIGVPGEILNKPGPLSDAEFEIMKQHTIIGEQIIAPIEFLAGVRPLVLHEHENWDGTGYPHNLKARDIPLGARIIFVCDAYHAMTSDRPYRKSLPIAEAKRRLSAAAGSQFDPQVVDAFLEILAVEEEHMRADSPLASLGADDGSYVF